MGKLTFPNAYNWPEWHSICTIVPMEESSKEYNWNWRGVVAGDFICPDAPYRHFFPFFPSLTIVWVVTSWIIPPFFMVVAGIGRSGIGGTLFCFVCSFLVYLLLYGWWIFHDLRSSRTKFIFETYIQIWIQEYQYPLHFVLLSSIFMRALC